MEGIKTQTNGNEGRGSAREFRGAPCDFWPEHDHQVNCYAFDVKSSISQIIARP